MMDKKNKLDEMQEQKLLKIERNGAWFAFWGLLAAIMIQLIIGKENILQNIAGEWIIFMSLAVYMGAACIKNGIWDRRLSPNPKTNVIFSLVAGICTGIIIFASTFIKYHKLTGSIAAGIFAALGVFASALIALSASAALYKKRVRTLEAAADKQSDDNKSK